VTSANLLVVTFVALVVGALTGLAFARIPDVEANRRQCPLIVKRGHKTLQRPIDPVEQIFTKLGVENRASAAAQATRLLTLRD